VTKLERVLLHLGNGLVAGTGIVYAVMRYLMRPADEWAVVNHPWQPHVQHLHVLSAPLLVFAVGVALGHHVIPRLRNGGEGRVSGIGLLVGFVPMTASGYLLQTAVDPMWRSAWVAAHLASSALWLAALAIHQIRRVPSRQPERVDAPSPIRERSG
jgi:hypothetical protein